LKNIIISLFWGPLFYWAYVCYVIVCLYVGQIAMPFTGTTTTATANFFSNSFSFF